MLFESLTHNLTPINPYALETKINFVMSKLKQGQRYFVKRDNHNLCLSQDNVESGPGFENRLRALATEITHHLNHETLH